MKVNDKINKENHELRLESDEKIKERVYNKTMKI